MSISSTSAIASTASTPGPDEELRHADQAEPRHRRLDHADRDGEPGHGRAGMRPPSEPAATGVDRKHDADEQCAHEPELERRAAQDQREVGAAVVEHHDLVDHRQLEMRGRIVDRDAASSRPGAHRGAPRPRAAARARRAASRPRSAPPTIPVRDALPETRAARREAEQERPAPPARRTPPRGSRPCLRSSSLYRAPRPS